MQSAPSRDELNIIKAFAIGGVLLSHMALPAMLKSSFLFWGLIDMCVPVFMIISGLTLVHSYEKQKVSGLNYVPFILRKLNRLLIPAIPFSIIGGIYRFSVQKKPFSFSNLLLHIVDGVGPGSYYIPCIVGIVLFFPLLYQWTGQDRTGQDRRGQYYGVLAVGLVITVLYHILFYMLHLSSGLYRLLFFRYIFFLTIGMFLYKILQEKRTLPLSLLIGSLITGFCYSVFIRPFPEVKNFFSNWESTAFPVGLTSFSVLILFFRYLKITKYNCFPTSFFLLIGKASWHIFLVQMLLFEFSYSWTVNLLHCYGKAAYYISGLLVAVFSVLAGIGYFYLEKKFRSLYE